MKLITFSKSEGQFWFRLWNNYGLSVQDHRVHPPYFSERNGYVKVFHLGPFCFQAVKPMSRTMQKTLVFAEVFGARLMPHQRALLEMLDYKADLKTLITGVKLGCKTGRTSFREPNVEQNEIRFANGSIIKAKPMGDGSKIRGLRGGIIWFDEQESA